MSDLIDNLHDYLFYLLGLIFAYWPFAAAFGLGILLPAIVVTLSSVSTKWSDHLKLTTIFASAVIGSALAIAFSGRTIISETELAAHPNILATITIEQGNPWFSRIANLILLSVSSAEIFMWVIRKRHMGKTQFKLWAAAITFFILSVIVSGLIGTWRDFDFRIFSVPLVFTAIALLASSDFKKTLQTLRWILLLPLLGSLVGILVAPHLVMETGYEYSLIPGFHIRLLGLTEHANSLGTLAAVAFLLELSQFVCNKPNMFLLLISMTNLVLAQSKTAWIIAIIGFVILRLNDIRKVLTKNKISGALAIFSGISVLASMAVFFAVMKINSLQDFLIEDKSGLSSFSGRTKIWEVTWDEFLDNPITGYGPSIWDLLYRYQHGMMYVGQAHNQYIQTLGQAGLLGILSLAFYIFLLVRNGFKGWNETQGFSIIMVAILLIRGLSEAPMRMLGVMDLDFFVHALTFFTIASLTISSKQRQQFV